ncbi:hypothetical protein D3C83_82900 [compost metagenome]
MVGLLVPVLEPPLVAPELLLDLVRRLLEGLVRVLRLAVTLEDQALIDVEHDIAGERPRGRLAESDRG